MKNILNLKKDPEKEVQIIEKIVKVRNPLWFELSKVLAIILVVIGFVWGVSNADEITEDLFVNNKEESVKPVSFAVVGIVTDITDAELTLGYAEGYMDNSDLNIYISDLDKIETNTFDPLLVTDVLVGDKVIVQGYIANDVLFANGVISFAGRFPDTEGVYGVIEPNISYVAEVIATTTDATTTEATTTDATSTTESSSTTDETSIVDSIGEAVGDVIETVGEVIEDIVDTLTGNEESEDNASSTEATSTESENNDESSTGGDTASSEESTSSEPVVEETPAEPAPEETSSDPEPTPEPVSEPAPEPVPEPEPTPEPTI